MLTKSDASVSVTIAAIAWDGRLARCEDRPSGALREGLNQRHILADHSSRLSILERRDPPLLSNTALHLIDADRSPLGAVRQQRGKQIQGAWRPRRIAG
jgi:hypothetical protein